MEVINKCPECGCIEIKECGTKAELICVSCGLVIDDAIIEKNPYSENHQTVSKIGIAGTGMFNGKIVKSTWLLSNKEKNFLKAKRKISFITSKLNLPSYILESTKQIYIETIDKKLSVGRSIEGMVVASVYIACLKCEIVRTIDEIVKISCVSKKETYNCLKAIKREFNIDIQGITAYDLLDKYMNQLKYRYEARKKAINIYNKVKDTKAVQGKNPKSIAAAILYIVSKELKLGITQRELSHRINVFETTIRKRYMEIEEVI